jgi:prepilin-type N-terminal cleavage/methylation domain-containing protein
LSVVKRAGMTITEVLVCVAIVAVCVAITVPVYRAARIAGLRSATEARLHQLWIALQMYRDSIGHTSQSGSLYDIGLPPERVYVEMLTRLRLQPALPHRYPSLGWYYLLVPEPALASTQMLDEWTKYSNACQERAAIVADYTLSDVNPATSSPYEFTSAIGLQLSGGVVRKRQRGAALWPHWWGCN